MSAISTGDRGFTLGDGLFETVLVRAGELVLWDEHLARLSRGCDVMELPAPDPQDARAAARTTVLEAGLAAGRAAVRLSWTAGVGGRGLDRPEALQPRLFASAAPAPRDDRPLSLVTASVRRNDGSPAARLKTLAYLDNILARRQARAAGGDEALMLNTVGELACAAAANLFWIEADALLTPALDCGVLEGVMRAVLIERARAAGWPVHEVRAPRATLDQAEAVFLTNSLMGVRAVERLDDRHLAPHAGVARLAALIADLV